MPEIVATDLTSKKVKETYKGILHFDSSLQNNKKDVYDGAGSKTALTLGVNGQGADINGVLNVTEDAIITGNSTVSGISNVMGSLSVGGDVYLNGGGYINNLKVGTVTDPVTIRATNTAEVGKLRIRETETDYELIFGNPNNQQPNLFSIIVKNDGSNNLYIKNNYNTTDIDSPLWINRSSGEVNIKNLNVGKIMDLTNNNGSGTGGGGSVNSNRYYIPPGVIMMYSSLTIPQGWLVCNGDLLDINSEYNDLYKVIQQTYKTLTYDETEKFQLPDLRGVFIRGLDMSKNLDPTPNRTLGSYQEDEFKSHNHPAKIKPGGRNAENNGNAAIQSLIDSYTDNAGGEETRPKNIALIYCIKW